AGGFNGTFTALAACCNGTFSVLNTVTTNQQGTFSLITSDFNQTWTILNNLQVTATVNFSPVFTQVAAGFNGTFSALAACCNGTFSALADIRSSVSLSPVFTAIAGGFNGTFSALAACCNGTFSVLNTVIANELTILTNQQGTFTQVGAGFNGTFSVLNTISNAGTFSALAACCNGTFSALADIRSSVSLSPVFTAIAGGFNGTFSALAACCNGTFSVLNTVTTNQQGTFSALAACCNGTFSVLSAGFNGTFSQVAAGFNGTFSVLSTLSSAGTFSVLNRLDQDNCSPTYITQQTFGPIGGAQTPLTINAPGVYRFASNVVYTPAGAGTQGITINSSNVMLDISCFTFSQQGGVAATDAIRVNSGFNDITIKNGMIANFTSRGITVQSNVQRIVISDTSIVGCGIRGIELLGGATKSSIVNGAIRNCNILQGLNQSTADRALYMQSCTDFQVTNCTINGNGLRTTTNILPLDIDNCQKIAFRTITIDDNTGANVTGVRLFNASIQCSFQDCILRNNMASGNARGFLLESNSTSTGNQFLNCTVLAMSGSAAVDGFFTGTGCNDNLFMDCKALQNTSTGSDALSTVRGFNFNSCQRVAAANCVSESNVAPSSTNGFAALGFDLNTTTSCDLINCFASDNNGITRTNGVGFRIVNGATSATGAFGNTVRDCYASGNPVGFRLDPASGTSQFNAFIRNISVKNVTQYIGFAATSISSAASMNNLNAINAPWSNLGVG
ncbi:hypothetical protein HYX58_00125, partial [Candidatus Dependentiae bacterium]|nr:hypothetical protein [Candidatus Dependentiae bacterium]